MSKLTDGFEAGFDEDWTVLYSHRNIAGVPEMIKRYERRELEVLAARDLTVEEQRVMQQFEGLLPLLVVAACREIEKNAPRYLLLPAVLSSVEQDRFQYTFARSYGRLWFRMDQYTVNDDLDLVRVPLVLSRQAIHDFVSNTIRLADKHLAVALPLVYRVGVVVGWLSALAVSQLDDAQAGMVLLAAFVSPLLVPQRVSSVAPGRLVKALSSAPARKPHRRSKPVLK